MSSRSSQCRTASVINSRSALETFRCFSGSCSRTLAVVLVSYFSFHLSSSILISAESELGWTLNIRWSARHWCSDRALYVLRTCAGLYNLRRFGHTDTKRCIDFQGRQSHKTVSINHIFLRERGAIAVSNPCKSTHAYFSWSDHFWPSFDPVHRRWFWRQLIFDWLEREISREIWLG